MSNKKKVIINTCDDCPFFDNYYYNYAEECTKLNRVIKEVSLSRGDNECLDMYRPIPNDCPLEDADE